MAKKAQQNTIQQQDGGLMMQQQVISDDSLLPPAEEIQKLNAISPDIVPWIMARTEMEQDARLKFNDERINLAKNESSHTHWFDFIALFMAFIIVAAFLFLSYLLIQNGSEVVGTIFAGATMALIVSYFLKGKKNTRE